MNVNKLKGMLVTKGMNVETLAEMIGTERSSLYRKLNNSEKITIGEAARMKDALNMSDEEAYDIFLA
jgi:plasmid maintenance system antidote protein VapI